ncbi:signal peptidase II [Nostoc minutum NIES-26]|uniref:Lipoprotein signal peptidase n=1 Tax=Nostoc minutum NIES-26 TaxID=1844469 RepID=A0A367QKQ7_9NOSO|nr:signal peptidase II [Dendronalium sp. ChiSLP03b]MDZ8207048.1 signal peptidase II [Dendronalium sp. ChiSLP03b]RCJ24776.1 signal peptidase II [Nostoc minutum NIES-26]
MVLLKNRLFWIAAFLAVILDRLTKNWVVEVYKSWPLETVIDSKTGNIIYRHSLPLIQSIFHFTYVTNDGGAFSILSGRVDLLRWLSLAVSLALIAFALFGPVLNLWEQLGYGLILGGAIGNGIDRFVLSYVIDFLDFRLINFAVFNIADSCISIGIVCLLIASFKKTPTSNHRSR